MTVSEVNIQKLPKLEKIIIKKKKPTCYTMLCFLGSNVSFTTPPLRPFPMESSQVQIGFEVFYFCPFFGQIFQL